MKNATINAHTDYSLYIDGQYCECNAPYVKNGILMIPFRTVAVAIGRKVEHNKEQHYYLVYRDTVFDKDVLTLRYVPDGNGSIRLTYYIKQGEILKQPTPDITPDGTFVPLSLFETAFGCTVSISDSGNINLRTAAESAKD